MENQPAQENFNLSAEPTNKPVKFGLSIAIVAICLVATAVAVYWIKTEPIVENLNIFVNQQQNQTAGNISKIYSVDELVDSKIAEGTTVNVKGTVADCIELKVTADYEGPGSGCSLKGDKNSIFIDSSFLGYKNKEITVNGKVAYCGGKKVSRYLCKLTDLKIIDDIAGWQTYRNEEYGFEFKYPADLLITDDIGSTNDRLIFFHSTKNPYAHLDVVSEIKIFFLDKIEENYYLFDKSIGIKVKKNNNIYNFYPNQINNSDVFIPLNDKIAIIFSADFKTKVDQTLSTFKFIK